MIKTNLNHSIQSLYCVSFLTLKSDNRREFNNQSFRDMAKNLNIVVNTTAAESPRSNGLNEHHNRMLEDMVKKNGP